VDVKLLNVVVGWFAFLLHTWEVTHSDLTTEALLNGVFNGILLSL
jgi:hypothetical protein